MYLSFLFQTSWEALGKTCECGPHAVRERMRIHRSVHVWWHAEIPKISSSRPPLVWNTLIIPNVFIAQKSQKILNHINIWQPNLADHIFFLKEPVSTMWFDSSSQRREGAVSKAELPSSPSYTSWDLWPSGCIYHFFLTKTTRQKPLYWRCVVLRPTELLPSVNLQQRVCFLLGDLYGNR